MDIETQSWCIKYTPHSIKDIVGNVTVIEEVMKYIREYRMNRNRKTSDYSRAIIISGPGGCGKTSFANIASIYRGMIPIEVSASHLRRKEEIQQFLDIYKSNVIHNYPRDSPLYKAATKCLEISRMIDVPVGKCMILDELDAIGMSERGLSNDIMNLLKLPTHDPDTLMIITCNEETLNKIKTLKGQCYHVSFKAISPKDMSKVIDVVSEKENLPLTDEDKQKFVAYANGDVRRLLNGMEFCFKNGISEFTQQQLSSFIQRFVEGNEDIVRKLQYSTMSAEKILQRTIELSLEGDMNMNLINVIEPEMYTIPLQFYQTYLHSAKNTASMSDLADVMDEISNGEEMLDNLKEANPGIMGEDMGNAGGDGEEENEECRISDLYILSSVYNPISKYKGSVAKPVRLNTFGYAKAYGLMSTLKGQKNSKIALKAISPYFANMDFEELRYISSELASWIRDKKYTKLVEYCISLNADPNDILEAFSNIKVIKNDDEEFKTAVNIDDVWKNQVKKDITKEYLRLKPRNVGVKSKDPTQEEIEAKKPKNDFFSRYKK